MYLGQLLYQPGPGSHSRTTVENLEMSAMGAPWEDFFSGSIPTVLPCFGFISHIFLFCHSPKPTENLEMSTLGDFFSEGYMQDNILKQMNIDNIVEVQFEHTA